MKISELFIWKFSFFGGEIFYIFEEACFVLWIPILSVVAVHVIRDISVNKKNEELFNIKQIETDFALLMINTKKVKKL